MTMICPECGSEYREGFVRCSDCDVALVDPPPPEPEPELDEDFREPQPDVKLVKVYESGNEAIIAVLESVMADAGIEVMIKGDELSGAVNWGRLGLGPLARLGPAEVWVREDDVQEAAALIAELEAAPPVAGDES